METKKNLAVTQTQQNRRPYGPSRPPTPTPSESVIRRDGEIRFFMDEESNTPFIQNVQVPTENPDPPFSVQNYKGYSPDPNSPQALAANCMATLCSAQRMLKKYLGTLPKWAAVKVLRVYPNAGNQLNAFYNRESLQFFTGRNPVNGQVVHTCLSNDVVTHEFFHSVLDSLKPVLFNTPFIEQGAFHEAFADCGSILHAMSIDPVLTYTAQQMDAAQSSTIASSVAPDLGYAINGVIGGLRDASVPYYYIDPATLPRSAPKNQLSSEVHSFSRVFSSAFYAAIMAVYAKVKAPGGIGTREALIIARDEMATVLFRAVQNAPLTPRYMASIASTMLTELATGPYATEVASVFATWGLTTVRAASTESVEVLPTDKAVKIGDQDFLIREKSTQMVLADTMIVGQSDNPLYFCKVDVPHEQLLVAQGFGMAGFVDGAEDEEILDEVKLGLDYIWESDLVTLHGEPVKDHHVFKVDESGSLLRTSYNSDDGYFNNATLPGAPEFGKPWKPENNSGCCSGCKKKVDPPVRPPKLGCYVNERVCGSRTVRSCQVVRQKVC
jgi:hypothetical protein